MYISLLIIIFYKVIKLEKKKILFGIYIFIYLHTFLYKLNNKVVEIRI